jgi:hypothetical protein
MTKTSNLENRLRKLERQNRRLRLIVYSGLVAVAGGVLMAQTRPARTIEAERFVVRDGAGNVRAEFGLNDDGMPRLAMYQAAQDIESIWLGVQDAVPLLTLQRVGHTFQSQLTEGLFFVRGANSGGLSLRDRFGSTRARINWPGREVSLGLYSPEGETRVVAALDAQGTASIGLPYGGERGAQMYSRAMSLGMVIYDSQGRLRYGIDVPPGDMANLGIFDDEGRTLFGVP